MAQYTVYITRKIWQDVRRQLEKVGSLIEWDELSPVPREELLLRVGDADALLCTGSDLIDREVITAGAHLKIISTMSAGFDHIDVATAAARGIIVCHTPGAANEAVADMTMALLLACARNVIDADAFVKNRQWRYWASDLFLGADVQGSTIGIIGFGNIGIQVAHRALGFGMRVLYFDPHRNHDAELRMGVQYGGLDNVLRESDFITLHVPLLADTYGLINERRLHLMKPTAYLINMARGQVVDHHALVRALREHWIAGAGLDVFAEEPIRRDDPLLDLPNVVLSPHIGANTYDGIGTMMRMAAEQVVDLLEGRKPAHPISLPPQERAA